MNITFLFLFGFFWSVACFDFDDPGEAGVSYDQNVSTIDEDNNIRTIKIVKIINVADEIIFTDPGTATSKLLNLQLEGDCQADKECYLTANTVDYEKLDSPNFPIDIYEKSNIATAKTLVLRILNLDDEYPTLSASNCGMDENLLVDTGNSNCKFTVSDPDGWLNSMDFSNIENPYGDIFELKYQTPPSDTAKQADVYLVLKVKLDYETKNLYSFSVSATDKVKHPTTPEKVPIIVQVIDQPDEVPRWDGSFKSAVSIIEKKETTIQVSATDGDIGINNPINYQVEDSSGFISVDKETGVITIQAINRDAGYNDLTFNVTAYEVPDPNSFIVGNINLIIEDIDDNVAVISVGVVDDKKVEFNLDEGSSELNTLIAASDIDLASNAIYSAVLQSIGDTDFTKAFTIIPSRGYENTSLSLTILDPKLLDFETPEWKVITLQLKTIGSKTPTNTDYLNITITLLDINDEKPIFDKDNYEIDILESATIGATVATIQATDKDAEDIAAGLTHQFLGTMANNILAMPDTGGLITTKIDNAFDYEKQQEVIVQIQATDKASHQTTAQLTISVIDVNDENPRLSVSSTINVEENRKEGEKLKADITATDEDSEPYLIFSIDWDNSYAMKNSIKLKDEIFKTLQFIKVETIRSSDTNKTVSAQLTIIETQKDNTPDFETFDNLYLRLVVTDLNTEKPGAESDSATIVISIVDLNDNAPKFPDGTENETRTVVENSANGVLISSPIAKDADVGDKLTYSIESADPDTPEWVTIDPATGSISVELDDGEELDCDDPPRENLKYKITVTDGVHETSVVITIDIIDDNDEKPTLADQNKELEEVENGDYSINGHVVITLQPEDKDRSDPFKTVVCSFSTSTSTDVTNRFKIDNNVITVELQEDYNLDREEQDTYRITLSCRDNPAGSGNKFYTVDPPPVVTITLTDINDNPPYIENTEITGYTENSPKGTEIILKGADKDMGDNAKVTFETISKIQRFDKDSFELDPPPQDLFILTTSEDNKGILTVNYENLSGYYGTLNLNIHLKDKGTPTRESDIKVKIQVDKFNFAEPKFYSPSDNEYFYLQDEQTLNDRLIMYDGETKMDNINATDQQNNKFKIDFTVVNVLDKDKNPINNLFAVVSLGNTWGELRIINSYSIQQYEVTVRAEISDSEATTIPGNAANSKNVTFIINFFDKDDEDPVFVEHEDSTSFIENQAGLTYTLPRANYTKDDLPPNVKVYYLLAEGDKTLFEIDDVLGIITLMKELDYEAVKQYSLVIRSSNSPKLKQNPIDDTKFTLTVNVADDNDNPPIFDKKTYITTCNIASGSNSGSILVTVLATDVDTVGSNLQYKITSAKGSSDDLNKITDPFSIDNGGNIKQAFDSTGVSSGYFLLDVLVQDESNWDNHTDTTQVTIYLVTDDHLVSFTFENDQETVRNAKDGITNILDQNFQNYSYITNVGDPQTKPVENDSPRTASPVFFLSTIDKAPIEKTEIYKKVTNVNIYRKLRSDFLAIGLSLLSFDSDATTSENIEETLKAWLIGVSVVLGSLCMILLIAFILKTRTLNQRINKLSNTKFGSQESGLNRTGVAAPTTNKHAVEGSNPVYNNDVEKPEIEERRQSITSGDSDLIGVEDDEKFNYDLQNQDRIY